MADVYGTLRETASKHHPVRKIVYDDVYYSALVFEQYRHRPLTLIRAPFSEYVKERLSRLQPALIYHKLKHPMRFSYVANNSAALARRGEWSGHRGDGQGLVSCEGRPGWARALKEYNLDCCEGWVGCEWRAFRKWKDIPKEYRRSQGG